MAVEYCIDGRKVSGITMNDRQRRFVLEYLIDLDAKKAAIRAGYSPQTAGQQAFSLMARKDVADAITFEMGQRSIRTMVTADRVLEELARIGFFDLRRVVEWRGEEVSTEEVDEDGNTVITIKSANQVLLKDSDKLTIEDVAAIAEISQGKDGLKIKFAPKMAALAEIGRHLGIAQRHEVTGKNGGPIQTEELSARELLTSRISSLASRLADQPDASKLN